MSKGHCVSPTTTPAPACPIPFLWIWELGNQRYGLGGRDSDGRLVQMRWGAGSLPDWGPTPHGQEWT